MVSESCKHPSAQIMSKPNKHLAAIREVALKYPEAVEGSSCNKLSFKSGKKAFLSLGEKEDSYSTMLKLTTSLAEARKLARKHPKIHSA